jgi:hypothetical protein
VVSPVCIDGSNARRGAEHSPDIPPPVPLLDEVADELLDEAALLDEVADELLDEAALLDEVADALLDEVADELLEEGALPAEEASLGEPSPPYPPLPVVSGPSLHAARLMPANAHQMALIFLIESLSRPLSPIKRPDLTRYHDRSAFTKSDESRAGPRATIPSDAPPTMG